MDELHTKLICDKNNFVPKEGQRDLMCSNKESHRCPFLSTQNEKQLAENYFSEEELENISDLCSALQGIRNRILSEGHLVEDLRKELYGPNYNLK